MGKLWHRPCFECGSLVVVYEDGRHVCANCDLEWKILSTKRHVTANVKQVEDA